MRVHTHRCSCLFDDKDKPVLECGLHKKLYQRLANLQAAHDGLIKISAERTERWVEARREIAEDDREIEHLTNCCERYLERSAEVEKDAKRYRWLRDKTNAVDDWDMEQEGWGKSSGPFYLDARVDAALAQSEKKN